MVPVLNAEDPILSFSVLMGSWELFVTLVELYNIWTKENLTEKYQPPFSNFLQIFRT